MPALWDFPDNPIPGQMFTPPGQRRSYMWDGQAWITGSTGGAPPGGTPYVLKSGDTMLGMLTLAADPTAPLQAATKQYVDDYPYVHRDGDTMTGPLTLAADPVAALEPVTKQYFESHPAPPATGPEMVTGTRNDVYGTPLNTMALTGLAVTALTTGAKTLVEAINELKAAVDLLMLSGLFVGSFDAAAGTITWTTASGQSGNSLPAAAAGNRGWYLIADVAGSTPPNGAPSASYDVGDWLISDGTAWTRLAFGGALSAASSVAVNPAVNGATNVQAALETLDSGKVDGPASSLLDTIAIYADATGKVVKDSGITIAELQAGIVSSVVTDGVLITGDGTSTSPITLALVDGGEY